LDDGAGDVYFVLSSLTPINTSKQIANRRYMMRNCSSTLIGKWWLYNVYQSCAFLPLVILITTAVWSHSDQLNLPS